MFAQVRNEYVVKTIDRPIIPEKKISPKRSVICIVGTLLGCVFGICFVISRKYIKLK